MPADRPGGYAGVGAQFELAGEQVLHAILVHDQHDQINRLAADLQSEASTFDSEECRSAPPFRRTATGHAAAIARTHNKSTLQHGWHPFDTDAAYRRTEKDSDHLFFCKHTRHSCIYKQTIILRGIHSHGRTAH